jgi:hypothetical protein
MDWERKISEAAETQPATGAADAGHSRPAGPAPLTDVLFDQLEYLVGHAAGNCSEDCRDCRRLQMASDWLLLPFRCRTWM